ncbi:MAG TPA: pyridoxal phosphate-dependent aminotransferase [Bacteroidota bacterium]|nr:pyridoxal phosphate-dependent aminotransferase [Bacteroidota bacterium]
MFSHRTRWNLASNRLTTLLHERRSRGKPVIDLTNSNPTTCEFSFDEDEILPPLLNRSCLTYTPDPKGLFVAREAIADWYGRHGVDVDPNHIIITSGTSEAYSHIFKLLCDPGDHLLIPTPSYPLFEFLTQLEAIGLSTYRLNYDGEWHIDLSSLKSVQDRAKGIILLHPNNPTGSYIKHMESAEINRIAASQGIPLIVDEVFHPFSMREDTQRARSFAANTDVLTFTLNGLSKLCGLPQMKLSWIVVSGPAQQVRNACERLEVIADTYLSVSTPVQLAISSYLRSDSRFSIIAERVRKNYSALLKIVADSSVSALAVEGGWSAIMKMPSLKSDESWCEDLLISKGILLHPGHFYGLESASHVVCSFLPRSEMFSDGIRSIVDFVNEY